MVTSRSAGCGLQIGAVVVLEYNFEVVVAVVIVVLVVAVAVCVVAGKDRSCGRVSCGDCCNCVCVGGVVVLRL